MNLTAEQVELLKQKIEQLELELSKLERDATSNYSKRLKLAEEIKGYTMDLLTAVTLKTSNEDIIGLGSRFTATIDFEGSKDTSNYLISDSNIKVPGYMAISTKTPLAKAVMGLRENDEFTYNVTNSLFKGVIDSIHKENILEESKTSKLK